MPRSLKDLTATAKEVYTGYLALDMASNVDYAAKNSHFEINGKKQTLKDFAISLIQSGQTQADLHIGQKPCHLVLTNNDRNQWQIILTSQDTKTSVNPAFKPVNEQTADDLIELAEHHQLTLHQENDAFIFSATVKSTHNTTVTIGGPGKMDLYPLHISNLYALILHLEQPDSNPHMLIAMTTGTGKSFTQALWFLILRLENRRCILATESNALAEQLQACFAKLLPEDVLQRDGRWAIMTHKELLVDSWQTFQQEEDELFICIDEEHRAASQELLKKRINRLAERHSIMFLSATPSPSAYQLVDNKPLTSLSRAEKEALGISKPAVIEELASQGLVKKHKNKLRRSHRIAHTIVDTIEKERQSVTHEYVSRSETAIDYRTPRDPFYANPHSDMRFFARWNILSPVSEKALILTEKHDPVVNFAMLSQRGYCLQICDYAPSQQAVNQCDNNTFILYWSDGHWKISEVYNHTVFRIANEKLDQLVVSITNYPLTSEQLATINQLLSHQYHAVVRKSAYEHGNKVERSALYQGLLQLKDDLDEVVLDRHLQAQLTLRQQGFVHYLQDHGFNEEAAATFIKQKVDFGDTADYLNHRVLHGLIDFTLTYLTRYEQKQLDYRRFHQLDTLVSEVAQQIRTKKPNVYTITTYLLKNNIPRTIANQLAPAMMEIINAFNVSPDFCRKDIADNWSMDKELHHLFAKSTSIIRFIERHKTIFLLENLEKSPSEIQSNAPFYKLEEKQLPFDHEKVAGNKALSHKKTAMESTFDGIKQTVFTPQYCSDEYTEEVIDNLFRRGLIGAYITNKKAIGFNDPNLQHLTILVDSYEDLLNLPDNVVQGCGRLRGENWAKQPHIFVATKQNVALSFPTALLQERDYYSVLHKAQVTYQKELAKTLGEKIAKQIEQWIEGNIHANGSIDKDALEEQCHNLVMDEFERVYNNNQHDFTTTKIIFSGVLKDMYHAFYVLAERMKHTHHIPFLQNLLSNLLNLFARLYYKLLTLPSYFSFVKASLALANGSAEMTYSHIIRQYSYIKLAKIGILATFWNKRYEGDFKQAVLDGDATSVSEIFTQSVGRYIKNQEFQHIISTILSPLSDTHLSTILDAIFPTDSDNVNKLTLIKQFQQDIKKEPLTVILEKYVSDSDDLENIKFHHIISWIFQIYEELITAHCYYHNMDRKATSANFFNRDFLIELQPPVGNKFNFDNPTYILCPNGLYYIAEGNQTASSANFITADPNKLQELRSRFGMYQKTRLTPEEIQSVVGLLGQDLVEPPKLKRQSTHPIWSMRSTASNSFFTNVMKKFQFVQATSSSFPGMNRLHTFANEHVLNTMKATAEQFAKPLQRSFLTGQIVPSASSLFKHPSQLGKKMHDMQELSDAEVNSASTTYVNAIRR